MKKLITFLTLLTLFFTTAWAESVTLTQKVLDITVDNSYISGEKTIDGITYVYTDLRKSNTTIQSKANTGEIHNTTAFPGNIAYVIINCSNNQPRETTIWGSSNGNDWTKVVTANAPTGSSINDVRTITGDFQGKGYKYFKVTRGANTSYWNDILIIYTTGSDNSGDVEEYVDFGLPSGTLWATKNIGASRPEEYGQYFAWGETAPKEVYGYNSYKWSGDKWNTMTKYCTNSTYGTVDNKTELDPEDDAATANWGQQWRMPSKEQLDELRTQCTWKWTTKNGIKGYQVTKNGKSIFLPAAGYRDGNVFYNNPNRDSYYSYYWSRTLDTEEPNQANDVWFFWKDGTDSFTPGFNARYDGYTVRAVRLPIYSITGTGDMTGGSVTASATSNILAETPIILTIQPNNEYELTNLTVDGVDVTDKITNNQYTFNMPEHDVHVSATFSKVADLYIVGNVNGIDVNSWHANQGVKMNYINGVYTADIWVTGKWNNDMKKNAGTFAFFTVLANANDQGAWNYVNGNRYEPDVRNINNPNQQVGSSSWWLANDDNSVNTDVTLLKRNWNDDFLIPAGLYTVTVSADLTKFNLTVIKNLTPTITPNGGDVLLNSTATVALNENFNEFIENCPKVKECTSSNGSDVYSELSLTLPEVMLYVNENSVEGISSEYVFTTLGSVIITGKSALVAGGTEYAEKTASAKFNVMAESATLAAIEALGSEAQGKTYTISDELLAVACVEDGQNVYLLCKDAGLDDEGNCTSIASTYNTNNYEDYMIVHGGFTGDYWDQSNWIALKFNGLNDKDKIKGYENKRLVESTVTGRYADDENYTLEMSTSDLEIVTDGQSVGFTPNLYCPANFLTENQGACGVHGNSEHSQNHYYFFMNPKIQEVCEITFAVWNGTYFVLPAPQGNINDSNLPGAISVDWEFNDIEVENPETGKLEKYNTVKDLNKNGVGAAYRFKAIVKHPTASNTSTTSVFKGEPGIYEPDNNYVVSPYGFDPMDEHSIVTRIENVVVGYSEVKSVKYVNVAGIVSDTPFQGINIVVTEYTDGSRTTTKLLKK